MVKHLGKYILLLFLLFGCQSGSTEFGFNVNDVLSIRVFKTGQADGLNGQSLDRDQMNVLLDQLMKVQHPRGFILKVSQDYQIRIELKSGKHIILNSNGKVIALESNNDYFEFTSSFDFKNILK
jgi:hypothetical protein